MVSQGVYLRVKTMYKTLALNIPKQLLQAVFTAGFLYVLRNPGCVVHCTKHTDERERERS